MPLLEWPPPSCRHRKGWARARGQTQPPKASAFEPESLFLLLFSWYPEPLSILSPASSPSSHSPPLSNPDASSQIQLWLQHFQGGPLEVSSSGQLVVFRELWQVTTAFGDISSAVSFSACAYAGNSGVLPLLSSFYLPPSSPGQDIILEGGGPKFVPMVWEKQFLPFHIKTVI